MVKNSVSNLARKEKNDEFYTQITDIEKEMVYYKQHFRGKVVYCNCDDYRVSNFYNYFKDNFDSLELKRLVVSCHVKQDFDLFGENSQPERATKVEYDGKDLLVSELQGDGDFRSDECIELLKQADIVVTNPPFSLLREYFKQLYDYDKKFIILGNGQASKYKDIFELFKQGLIWFGASIQGGDREFRLPDNYPLDANTSRVDEQGNRYVRVTAIRWFTNLDYPNKYKGVVLTKSYSPEDYPTYDRYDAINVDKTKDIPKDYSGKMGVPSTFLDKYDPEQFELIEMGKNISIDGRIPFARIIVKNKKLS